MVSCQGNKSATWAGGMHASAGPSQHPSGELFLPDHAFLGSRPLMGQWQATGHVVTVNTWCIHFFFQSPVSIFLLAFCLGVWFSQGTSLCAPPSHFWSAWPVWYRDKVLSVLSSYEFHGKLWHGREWAKGIVTKRLRIRFRHQKNLPHFPHARAWVAWESVPHTMMGEGRWQAQSHPAGQRCIQNPTS